MMKLTVGCVLLALASNVAAVAEWGQCGGLYYTGSTSCDGGLTCVYFNDWYSQCLRVTTTQAPPPPTSTSTTQPPPPPSSTSTTVVPPPSSSSTTSPPPPPSSSTTPSTTSTPPTTSTGGTAVGASPTCAGANVANSLATKIKAKGKKYFGTAADAGTLSNTQNANVIKQQFNQLTPENSMKWDTIEASQNNFNFAGGDTLVSFGTTNCDFIRGHNFVWHSQLPSWVSSISSASTLTSVIQNHIVHEGGRWAGKIYSWDVCNEILDESGNMRSSVFSNVLGETFVSIAYKQARATDPIAKLYINDYNLDTATYAKTTGMVSKVKTWRSQGIPIDGIGSQSHLSAGGATGVQGALTALAGSGVSEVAITELDIAGGGASDYATTIKACLAVSACIGITVWGVSDKDSWRSSTTPLLFDSSYNPKPAWTSVIAAMS